MAIDARALVVPSIPISGVDAHNDDVLPGVIKVVGKVESKRRITVVVASNVAAIDENKCASKCAVKVNANSTPCVRCGNIKAPAVPADGSLRILAAKRLVKDRKSTRLKSS